MSGGEMQRVAIARALVINPLLLLADEPTGNLDSKMGQDILELMKSTSEQRGLTVVLVTHDLRAAAYGDRMITLRDGRAIDEVSPHRPADAENA
jgi:putative ABC transport system ATP-binding protein